MIFLLFSVNNAEFALSRIQATVVYFNRQANLDLFYRGIEDSLDREGRGDSRVLVSRAKRWVVNFFNKRKLPDKQRY